MLRVTRWVVGYGNQMPSLCSQLMCRRPFSNLSLSFDEGTKTATLSLNKKPVNSLSLEVLTEISDALKQGEDNKKCQGLIVTSGVPRIFSAGLDILEMYQPKEDRLRQFWRTLQEVWLQLYGSRLATIAAVNGNAPAGGCLLALSCDYRIMADGKYSIGLNEAQLGIVAPFWFQSTMSQVVGQRETESALMLGRMYSAKEAHAIKLVDCLVPEEDVLMHAQKEMARWIQIPAIARQLTKQQLRGPILDELHQKREADIENFVKFCYQPTTQQGLGAYLEMLKKRSQAKK